MLSRIHDYLRRLAARRYGLQDEETVWLHTLHDSDGQHPLRGTLVSWLVRCGMRSLSGAGA